MGCYFIFMELSFFISSVSSFHILPFVFTPFNKLYYTFPFFWRRQKKNSFSLSFFCWPCCCLCALIVLLYLSIWKICGWVVTICNQITIFGFYYAQLSCFIDICVEMCCDHAHTHTHIHLHPYVHTSTVWQY